MSSTPYIEIDWSSASQHSYPQLVLSAKDILALDIDDIYPYTYSTLHLEDDDLEETYDDDEEDYFKQLLNTSLNAEIQEVNYGGNDLPPISSTPLIPIQTIDPLPPTNTAPISENSLKDEKKTTLPVSLKKSHVTTPKRTGYNKIYEIHKSRSTFSFLVSFEIFHVTAASKAGYNKIYECRRSKSFFFEVVDRIPDTNEIHLKIYTNDHHMLSTPIRYYSTSKLPNHRFQISKCLTHFFTSTSYSSAYSEQIF
uniref:Uncharacterized protein n=1 Tax=Rhizophagus irregularis (strain DAOM 181602 / DAOM 197198 / MUCL 43194) TaxID=747089 RepID=U9U5X8_RHIID